MYPKDKRRIINQTTDYYSKCPECGRDYVQYNKRQEVCSSACAKKMRLRLYPNNLGIPNSTKFKFKEEYPKVQ